MSSPERPELRSISWRSTRTIFFYSCFHLSGNLPLTYPPPFPLFSFFPFLSPVTSATSFPTARATFLSYRQSYPPWECDRSHSLLCCIAFARGHSETAENLCRYSRPFNRVCPSLAVSEKWPPARCFDVQAADRRSPIQVLTQRKAAWLGWSPGTGHLPHIEHCR